MKTKSQKLHKIQQKWICKSNFVIGLQLPQLHMESETQNFRSAQFGDTQQSAETPQLDHAQIVQRQFVFEQLDELEQLFIVDIATFASSNLKVQRDQQKIFLINLFKELGKLISLLSLALLFPGQGNLFQSVL